MKKKVSRFIALAVTSFMVMLSLIATSGTAYAAEAGTNACPEVGQEYLSASLINGNYHYGVGPVYRSGPGGSVRITTTHSYNIGVTYSYSGSISASAILQLALEIGRSDSVGYTQSQSYEYGQNITPGRYGNLQYGNWASEIRIVKERVVAPCNYVPVESGTAIVPTSKWGYRYWED